MKDRTIAIKAGVDTGSRIRVPAEGDAGIRGGESGDLYVVIHIKSHEFFERQGNDLYCEVPISFTIAALGGEIDVPTISGKETISVPEGTQTGSSFRMRERGIPDVNGRGRGDQYVQVKVHVPRKMTADQKQLLKQFAESMGDRVVALDDKGFLGRFFGGK